MTKSLTSFAVYLSVPFMKLAGDQLVSTVSPHTVIDLIFFVSSLTLAPKAKEDHRAGLFDPPRWSNCSEAVPKGAALWTTTRQETKTYFKSAELKKAAEIK